MTSKEELDNCIANTFWEVSEDEKRLEAQHQFIKAEAEKVGATADFKLVRDMTETEYMVRTALHNQGEEVNEVF